MAAKKDKGAIIARLTPNAIDVKVDGMDVRVATSKEENAILNMIMASQGRAIIQKALQKWQEMEEVPSPKELRDIAGAMREIAQMSQEVYGGAEPISDGQPKEAEKVDEADINFGDLNKPNDDGQQPT